MNNKVNENCIFEDDSHVIPEWILSMSEEEREAEMERLFVEMKAHPQIKDKVNIGIKTILDK